jgi:hypothetical protein
MNWPIDATSDVARIQWSTAMKFLRATHYDVNRALDLYKRHEVSKIKRASVNRIDNSKTRNERYALFVC